MGEPCGCLWEEYLGQNQGHSGLPASGTWEWSAGLENRGGRMVGNKRIEVVGHLVWGLMGHNEDLGLYPG